MTGAVEEAQKRLAIGTAVDSPAAAVATAGISMAVRNRFPVAYLPVGCEVPPGEGDELEDTALFIMDGVISVEVQRFDYGRRYLALSKSLVEVRFETLREKGPRNETVLAPKKVTRWATGQ